MSLIQPSEAVVAAPAPEPAVVAAPVTPVVADTTAALTPVVAPDPDAAPVAVAPVVAELVRPEGLPDSLWDAATGVKTTEALARLAELETASAARAADVPADAAGYKLEPAEPILDPVTQKPIAFNPEDPLAKSAVAWAHENGVGQAGLSKLLSVFAQNEMASLAAHNTHVAAETAKLGANHEARFAAVNAALTAHAGEAGAKAIMATLGSADAVIALEAVVKKLSGPSIGTPPAAATKASALADLTGVDLLSAVLK